MGERPGRAAWCALALLLAAAPVWAQTTQAAAGRKILRQSITVAAGAVRPVTGGELTRFWDTGPSASAAFHVMVSRSLAVGVTVEAARFRFERGAFAAAFPGVEAQVRRPYWLHVGVGARFCLMPGMRTSPFLSGTVGASHVTRALHQIVANRERTTYYAVGGTTRLTFAAGAGVNIYFHRALALELEGSAAYVHNDPDVETALGARGGLRFLF